MLCAGSIRRKNVVNIMLKNFLDACGGALAASGRSGIHRDERRFFLAGESFADGSALIAWFHQFGFAAAAATIVAGSVAERCKFEAYLFYSLMLTGFIYPVVVYSIWSDSGFLSPFNDDPPFGCGMIDFAGSGVVHVTGGATALIATTILGSRIYDAAGHELYEPHNFPPYSVALQALGTFLLVVGWFGFNPGSTLAISSKAYGDAAALAAVTTVLGATSAAVCAMITDMILNRRKTGLVFYDTTMCINGLLSGCVGITAGCAIVEPWAAVVIGVVSGWVYISWSKLLIWRKVDDPVDAVPVHMGNGLWGCIAVGLFASPARVATAYADHDHYGWFYNVSDGSLLAAQILGVLWICGWVACTMTPFFLFLDKLKVFRVDSLEEEVGLDISIVRTATGWATITNRDMDVTQRSKMLLDVHKLAVIPDSRNGWSKDRTDSGLSFIMNDGGVSLG
ncbi:hypothetical protein ACHAXT_009656 [Thalassiosira profunda]